MPVLNTANSDFDLRAAINAVSDVVDNRPRAIREFDQIFMKTADMVLQSEFVARWADGKRLAFIGDGDAISVCVPYLRQRGILDYGPSKITVFDFDERICNAVMRFADRERLENLSAVLYNCLEAFPGPSNFDCFYTNPPYGASNEGSSVVVFLQRGLEAVSYGGEGLIVIADDPSIPWTRRVMANVQLAVLDAGYFVQQLVPELHSYHLDDAPELRSCNMVVRPVVAEPRLVASAPISDSARLTNFYGRDNRPRVRYVREVGRPDYGRAHTAEYRLELLEETAGD